MLAPSQSVPLPSQTRAIVLLAVAGFASQAMVRSSDSLLPQIAGDFAVTIGVASVVVWAYAFLHGSMQLVVGPFGDRFPKYRMIAIACAIASGMTILCGLAPTLGTLVMARLGAAAVAAWIIPLSIAYVGDVVPYDQRQPVLGRYLTGQIVGQLFGQAAGGVIGDFFGWRAVFFVLGAFFALASIALWRELRRNPITRVGPSPVKTAGLMAGYATVLSNPWARVVMFATFLEGAIMFGAFAYIGADLHVRMGLGFALVGLVIGMFGVGGLIYAGTVTALFARFGQVGLATIGGLCLGLAYLTLATVPWWWLMPLATTMIGLGFYMLHNTLQTNATQMSPEARGTAVCLFSAALYIGQPTGVALVAPVFDRVGAPPIFIGAAILLPMLGLFFAGRLRARQKSLPAQ